MTTSKFTELLDYVPKPATTTASKTAALPSRPHPDVVEIPPRKSYHSTKAPITNTPNSSTMRFPSKIDLTMQVPTIPVRHSSYGYSKKTLRKSGSPTSTDGNRQPAPSPFSGPDADFDFGGRPTAQRIEPESPSRSSDESSRRKSEDGKGHQRKTSGGGVKNRLRKLSLSAR